MAERYNFKYLPLVGKLPGKSMVEQTETAINELASVVYDNVGHVGNLAEEVKTANTNASNALDKATEALETSGRVYIKLIAAVDVNDYYDSELYYINNDGSTNIPVRDRGFLEVKTNDDKTACEQVFIADSTGTPYYRHGRITEQTLSEETTYVVTWGSWYRVATTEFVAKSIAREPQADWNVTDTTSKAYIKNKPDVLTYKPHITHTPETASPSQWEDNSIQSIAYSFPDDHPDAYPYGVKVTLGKIKSYEGHTNLYFAHNDGMYLKTYWGNANDSGWLTMLNDKNYSQFALSKDGTAVKATSDAAGNNIQTTYAKKSDLASSVPTGCVQSFAGSTTPQGWLLCDGSAVSRTDYAALYAVIGTTYGAGNGSTTFNLPNLVDKFVEGSATSGTVKSAGLPNITGTVSTVTARRDFSYSGSLKYTNTYNYSYSNYSGEGDGRIGILKSDANSSNPIYGNSTTVQPPALTMRYIVKY